MPPVSLDCCTIFSTVMRGFWKETCGVRLLQVRKGLEGEGAKACGNTALLDSSVTSSVLWRLQPHSCYPKQWLPFTECCPHAWHQTACHTGLIAPNSHQYWCFYQHPHLADEEVDFERVGDLPKVTQLLGLRAENKPGREQGNLDPKHEGGRRACVLARWVSAGDSSVVPLGRLKNTRTLPVVMNKSMHPFLFKTSYVEI